MRAGSFQLDVDFTGASVRGDGPTGRSDVDRTTSRLGVNFAARRTNGDFAPAGGNPCTVGRGRKGEISAAGAHSYRAATPIGTGDTGAALPNADSQPAAGARRLRIRADDGPASRASAQVAIHADDSYHAPASADGSAEVGIFDFDFPAPGLEVCFTVRVLDGDLSAAGAPAESS